MSDLELSVRFFLQLAVILAACRGVGSLARRIGQPQVVGEMIAGVVLGPSLLGWLLPGVQAYVFPRASMTVLYAVSQVGLSLYMFLVGLEFNTTVFRQRLASAASVSAAGMIAPFVLGGLIGFWLVQTPGFFGAKTSGAEAALFLGASMCITAFPMLARIIVERGLSGTSLGTLSLAAGAMDDAAAWCILAVVLASFGDSALIALETIGGTVLYAVLLWFVGRRWLARLADATDRHGRVTQPILAVTLTLVMLGAWYTDAIGIYAVFGAFMMGVAMPRRRFAIEVRQRLEPLTVVFLLPLFFTFSGLNTRLDLVNSPALWGVAAVVLLAACAGKGAACYLAARLHGEPHRDALAIGTLMNARGLMELIIVNIGLHKGIITPTLFSIMVVMAIVTTLMATPLFERFYGRTARQDGTLSRLPLDA